MAETQNNQPGHWLTLQSAGTGGTWGCRIESVGVKLPAGRLTTRELMSRTSHHTRIQLERLTGIHERHVVGPGENSFTLAAGAARDCLAHSQHQPQDIQVLINTSITRSKGRYTQSFEPPLSLYVKQAIGAAQAANFDLSNACAGMLTGVFVLQGLIARGEISCGMVVSGEYISHLSWNARLAVLASMSSASPPSPSTAGCASPSPAQWARALRCTPSPGRCRKWRSMTWRRWWPRPSAKPESTWP